MKNLIDQLDEIEALLPKFEKINKNISTKSVGWQINHLLLVINNVCKTLINSDPNTYKWNFNKTRLIVLTFGHIPRGTARAPKAVVSETFTQEDLQLEINNARSLLKRLNSLNKNVHFIHPYFGDINLKTTKRFLNVHTYHHLKIIRDIVK